MGHCGFGSGTGSGKLRSYEEQETEWKRCIRRGSRARSRCCRRLVSNSVHWTGGVPSPTIYHDMGGSRYLFSPYTIASCLAKSASPINNLAVLLSILGALTGESGRGCLRRL